MVTPLTLPSATNPTTTGKKASMSSPPTLNSSAPVAFEELMVAMDQSIECDAAFKVQSFADDETVGYEPAL